MQVSDYGKETHGEGRVSQSSLTNLVKIHPALLNELGKQTDAF